LSDPDDTDALLSTVDAAYIVILAFPLYVDSLPAGTIRALEMIASGRKAVPHSGGRRFTAIVNCGFPESYHNDTAINICCLFARDAGFEWAGGLSLGAGASLDGKPLDKAGGMARNVRKALDMAADDLAAGNVVSEAAIKTMAIPMMPRWMYVLFGNLGWWLQARKYGTHKRLHARPDSGGEVIQE
jgi:hypothetical protein